MSKEGKFTKCFLGFFCLLVCIIGLTGCKSKGYQGLIYHDKDLIAKTQCDEEVFLIVTPDSIVVRSLYSSYGAYWDKEVYKYINDGKYRVKKKECER